MAHVTAMTKLLQALDGQPHPDQGPRLEPAAERLRSTLGDGALRWTIAAVERSVQALLQRTGDTLAPIPALRAQGHHVLIDILLALAKGQTVPLHDINVDTDLVHFLVTRDLNTRDIAVELRQMQRQWLTELIAVARTVEPDKYHELLTDIAHTVATTVDTWISAIGDAVAQAQQRVAQAHTGRIRQAVEQLMAGETVPADATSRLMNYPLTQWHTCCVIGPPPETFAEQHDVETAIAAFARWANTVEPLRYDTTKGHVILWAAYPHPPETTAGSGFSIGEQLCAGIGDTHEGPEGFRRSWLEAHDAFRLASYAGQPVSQHYRDVALASLLTQDDTRSRWFVETELGELAQPGQERADMRHTLRVFFQTRMRIAPTAAQLYLHRNTLINRLERIEDMIGHRLSERTAELQAALAIAELFFAPDHPANA